MRKRPLLFIPAVLCADTSRFIKGGEAKEENENLELTATSAFASPPIAQFKLIPSDFEDDQDEGSENFRKMSIFSNDEEEDKEAEFGVIQKDQEDLIDLLSCYRTRSNSSQPSPRARAIDSPPRNTRSTLPPLPLELNRSQSRASQEIFDSLMQPSRGRADSQQTPDSLATSAISVSTTCSTSGGNSEDSKKQPICITNNHFAFIFHGPPSEIRRLIYSYLDWNECNPCFPPLHGSFNPPLAWVTPQMSDFLFGLRVEVFNDFDCRCSKDLQEAFLDPNCKSDNLVFFIYRRLMKLGVPYSLWLTNQLAYTAKCALKLIENEIVHIEEVLGFLLVATIIETSPSQPADMKRRVIRELKQLRDGLLELALELGCELAPKFLDSLARLVAEDKQLDTLKIISKLTDDLSIRRLCSRLGLKYSKLKKRKRKRRRRKKKKQQQQLQQRAIQNQETVEDEPSNIILVTGTDLLQADALAFGIGLLTAFVGAIVLYFTWEWISALGIKF